MIKPSEKLAPSLEALHQLQEQGWHEMRKPIIEHFPKPLGLLQNPQLYLQHLDDVYASDAYHSLSIEGYRVSRELIEQVRSGNWNPESNENDDTLNSHHFSKP